MGATQSLGPHWFKSADFFPSILPPYRYSTPSYAKILNFNDVYFICGNAIDLLDHLVCTRPSRDEVVVG